MAPKNRMVGFCSHFDPVLNGTSKTTYLGVGLLVCFSFFFDWLKTLALVCNCGGFYSICPWGLVNKIVRVG